jgi:predicted HTH domain antitoxin
VLFRSAPFNEVALRDGVQVALALKLFDDDVITLRQAARMAVMKLADFMALCTAREIPLVRLSADELAAELAHVEELAGRR